MVQCYATPIDNQLVREKAPWQRFLHVIVHPRIAK